LKRTDSHEQVRRALLQAHDFRREGNVAGLIALLQSHDELDVRLFAARALGRLNDKLATTVLAEVATTDPDHRVREAALRALAKIDRDAAIPPLIDQFRTGPRGVRRTAASLLSNSDPEEATCALEDALRDGDWYVRFMGAVGLVAREDPTSRELVLEARRRERNPVLRLLMWRMMRRRTRR
jgi:HEAT repeat protein